MANDSDSGDRPARLRLVAVPGGMATRGGPELLGDVLERLDIVAELLRRAKAMEGSHGQ